MGARTEIWFLFVAFICVLRRLNVGGILFVRSDYGGLIVSVYCFTVSLSAFKRKLPGIIVPRFSHIMQFLSYKQVLIRP